MQRIPLRRGTSVAIDGKSYVIGDVIGEGGFSRQIGRAHV